MLAVEGHQEQWCAGEAWLRDHGFVAIIDAWALPVPAATSDEQCAATLEAALAGGLGVEPDARLEHVLTHPGVLEGIDRLSDAPVSRGND